MAAIDLHALCSRLTKLGGRKPDDASRAEVEEALHSKWEGVQVTAARALAMWGDARSLYLVQQLLVEVSQKPARWAAAGALVRALAPHLTSADLPWIVDLFVRVARRDVRFCLVPLFEALEPRVAIPMLEVELAKATGLTAFDLRVALRRVEWLASQRQSDSAAQRQRDT
jgi:hypothetical protein